MRSCALRILDTEIISMALVIFFVDSKFLILPRISLPVAMDDSYVPRWSTLRSGKALLEDADGGAQFGFGVLAALLERLLRVGVVGLGRLGIPLGAVLLDLRQQ